MPRGAPHFILFTTLSTDRGCLSTHRTGHGFDCDVVLNRDAIGAAVSLNVQTKETEAAAYSSNQLTKGFILQLWYKHPSEADKTLHRNRSKCL